MNNDGSLELVVLGIELLGPTGVVRAFVSNGDGTFTPLSTTTFAGFHNLVGVGDVTGSGNVDIVLGNFGDNSVAPAVLPGLGDGTFGSQFDVGTGASIVYGGVADVTGDGNLDIFGVPGETNTPSLFVVAGDGEGGFELLTPLDFGDIGGFRFLGFHSGDFTGDGRLDSKSSSTKSSSNCATGVRDSIGGSWFIGL